MHNAKNHCSRARLDLDLLQVPDVRAGDEEDVGAAALKVVLHVVVELAVARVALWHAVLSCEAWQCHDGMGHSVDMPAPKKHGLPLGASEPCQGGALISLSKPC